MASAVTYQGDVQRSDSNSNGLFEGKKLWFSHSVPARTWLMQNAERNGAQIVQLEQQADVKLVDHARKNQAPGTHSYRYVELSIQRGRLEDLDAHRVGSASRVERPVGSVVTASKGSRNKFTEADEQLLWDWVKPFMDAGGAYKGNEIYKQLEKINPNHTYQSWRDHWLKHTQYQTRRVTAQNEANVEQTFEQAEDNPRSPKKRRLEKPQQAQPQQANIGILQSKQGSRLVHAAQLLTEGNPESTQAALEDGHANVEPIAETQHDQETEAVPLHSVMKSEPMDKKDDSGADNSSNKRRKTASTDDVESSVTVDDSRLPLAYNFNQKEARMLYNATCHILNTRADKLDESWAGVAKEFGHTIETWRRFFYDVVVPEYKKRNGIKTQAELEARYTAQVREQQERLAKASMDSQFSQGQFANKEASPQVSIDVHTDQRSDLPQENIQSDEWAEVPIFSTMRKSMTMERSLSPQLPRSSMDSADFRPPQPNEARKLGQGRGSQSTSSQSQVQPSLTSQPWQRVQPSQEAISATIPKKDAVVREGDNLPDTALSQHPPEATETHAVQDSITDLSVKSAEFSPALQSNKETRMQSSQYVTQISRNTQTASVESSTELQDIPYRMLSPPHLNPASFSPLFVPEEPRTTLSPFPNDLDLDQLSDIASSALAVQLVDVADEQYEADRVSEYAASEAPSEGIVFESSVELSQAWETAPNVASAHDVIHAHGNEEGEDENYDQTLPSHAQSNVDYHESQATTANVHNSESAADEQRSNTELKGISQNEESNDSHYVMAPTSQLDKSTMQHNRTRNIDNDVRTSANGRVETQALFQQSIQEDLAQLVALPEPIGGWDDQEIASTENMSSKITEDDRPAEAIDWTLPLPELDVELEVELATQSKEDDGARIDTWLANESNLHSTLSPLLLKPLLHQALETTSMDLDLASAVAAKMVERFENGSYNAQLSLFEVQRLPNRERKTAVAKMIDDLTPSDMRGCWTKQDDQALLGMNGREVKRVEDKHGKQQVRNRFEFLEMWFAT